MTGEAITDLEKLFLTQLQQMGHSARVIDLLDRLKKKSPDASNMSALDLTQVITSLAGRGYVDTSQRGVVKTRPSGIAFLSGKTPPPAPSKPATTPSSMSPQPTPSASASTPPFSTGTPTTATSAPPGTAGKPASPDGKFDPANLEEVETPLLEELLALGGTAKITDLHGKLAKRAIKEGDFRLFECVTAINALVGKGLVATAGRGVVRLASAGRAQITGESLPADTDQTARGIAGDGEPAGAAGADKMSLKDLSKMYQKKINTEMMGRFSDAKTRPKPRERPSSYRVSRPSAPVTVRSFEPLDEEADIDKIVEHRQKTVKEELLTRLPHIEAKTFSVICRNVLEAVGFTRLHQTEATGDFVMQGHGPLKPVGSDTAPEMNVAFRCVLSKSPVGADVVDAVREQITGSYDQGILLTNGTFAPEAHSRSVRPGTVPVVLMDSEAIVEEMMKNDIGVKSRQVTLVEIDRDFLK